MDSLSEIGFDWEQALRLPRRSRLALGLASARRVEGRLEKGAKLRTAARAVLTHGWRWILRPNYALFEVEDGGGDARRTAKKPKARAAKRAVKGGTRARRRA